MLRSVTPLVSFKRGGILLIAVQLSHLCCHPRSLSILAALTVTVTERQQAVEMDIAFRKVWIVDLCGSTQ